MTVLENSPTTSLCAVVVNPQVNIQESVQIDVFSVNATAKGKQPNYIANKSSISW